jgi:putative FmdB family regulatory protein
MPTYEYECKSCGHGFEVFQSMSDPPLKDCPECGKEVRRLILGGTGVIFKGSGFYVTDKGKTANSGTSKKETPASSDTPAACSGCPAKSGAAACPVSTEASKAPSAETKTA